MISDEEMNENFIEEVPEEILLAAENLKEDLLPEKSRKRYEKEYTLFCKWSKEKKNVNFEREEVFLAYFYELSKSYQPSTLWSRYSMLKTMLKLKKNVDIGMHFKLISFLKKKMVGFRPKKSKILTTSDMEKFIDSAPDDTYLLIKVATIFGLAGACRREELTNLLFENVQLEKCFVLVKIADNKTHTSRSFVVTGEKNLALIRKYVSLRPKNTSHQRFFVQYRKGECTIQCVGINKFGKMPSEVAAYLRLPNPEEYTGHCYRRSSATALANAGVGITNLKRHGGWQSTKVAEGYLNESLENKKLIASKILKSTPASASTSSCVALSYSHPATSTQHEQTDGLQDSENELQPTEISIIPAPQSLLENRNQLASAINLNSASNCTFTINYNINK